MSEKKSKASTLSINDEQMRAHNASHPEIVQGIQRAHAVNAHKVRRKYNAANPVPIYVDKR